MSRIIFIKEEPQRAQRKERERENTERGIYLKKNKGLTTKDTKEKG